MEAVEERVLDHCAFEGGGAGAGVGGEHDGEG